MKTITFLILIIVLNAQSTTVGILIFDGFLTSEVTGPFEIFGSEHIKNDINVVLISENDRVIKSHENLPLKAHYTFANCPKLDVLIVPSSYNAEASNLNKNVVSFVRKKSKEVSYLASHCAGAFILGEAGLLDNKRVMTYVGGAKELKKSFPNAIVEPEGDIRVLVDGNLISSNGGIASYEASLVLLDMLTDRQTAETVSAYLTWNRISNAPIPYVK